jgi:glycerol-1-phosphate dehydrogenase [NAD(P)+]
MTGLVERALERASDTERVLLGECVLGRTGMLFSELFPGRPAIVVADETTEAIAGRQVSKALRTAGVPHQMPFVLPTPRPYASYENVQAVRAALAPVEAVAVAVGSGTINDLVKRASGELGRPYMVVATASSMDGYAAFGASIAKDGYKQNLECPAPRALVADFAVLRRAPAHMTASGFGDLIGKPSACADWIVADALGIEPIDSTTWELVQESVRRGLVAPARLHAGDPHAVGGLIEALVLSGLSIQAYSSSRPGSGAEHLFSHLWEMEGLGVSADPPLSHGFKVGVGAVAIAALYETLLGMNLGAVEVDALVSSWPTWEATEAQLRQLHRGSVVLPAAIAETRAKYVEPGVLRDRLLQLQRAWPTLRDKLRSQLLPAPVVQQMLDEAGAPTAPADIGLSMDSLRATYQRARTIRRRYTVLDLAYEAGVLDACVEALFTPGGYWAARAAEATVATSLRNGATAA